MTPEAKAFLDSHCSLCICEPTGHAEMRDIGDGRQELRAQMQCLHCQGIHWSANPKEIHAALRVRKAVGA